MLAGVSGQGVVEDCFFLVSDKHQSHRSRLGKTVFQNRAGIDSPQYSTVVLGDSPINARPHARLDRSGVFQYLVYHHR